MLTLLTLLENQIVKKINFSPLVYYEVVVHTATFSPLLQQAGDPCGSRIRAHRPSQLRLGAF